MWICQQCALSTARCSRVGRCVCALVEHAMACDSQPPTPPIALPVAPSKSPQPPFSPSPIPHGKSDRFRSRPLCKASNVLECHWTASLCSHGSSPTLFICFIGFPLYCFIGFPRAYITSKLNGVIFTTLFYSSFSCGTRHTVR